MTNKDGRKNFSGGKIKLEDLPNAGLEGMRINVIRQGGKYHYDYQDKPVIRTFEKAYITTVKGERWIYWTWKPEFDYDCPLDCGYSGVAIDSDNHKGSYLEVPTPRKEGK